MRQNQSRNSIQSDGTRQFGNAKLKLTGVLILVALACCSALTFVSRAGNQPEPAKPKASAALASSPTAAQTTSREPARFVRFNLFDLGIYPREVHVSKGLIAIAIEDYSGSSSGLVVERENASAPQQVGSVMREGKGWRGQTKFKLEPGRYIVFMADRPDNRALLVVEP